MAEKKLRQRRTQTAGPGGQAASPEQRAEEVASAAIWQPIDQLEPWVHNPRVNEEAAKKVADSIRRFGFIAPVVVWHRQDGTQRLVAGHTRIKALRLLLGTDGTFTPRHAPGPGLVPVRQVDFAGEAEADAYALADNRLGELAEWDDQGLSDVVRQLQSSFDGLAVVGWDDEDMRKLAEWKPGSDPAVAPPQEPVQRMSEVFGAPPFSVLDARQSYWQERKRSWLALGLRSGDGREPKRTTRCGLVHLETTVVQTEWMHRRWMHCGPKEGGSIFDPVLTEILLRWYCRQGGTVLDPFAGGSVRGVVSAILGHHYIGIDVRPEQVMANERQWAGLRDRLAGLPAPEIPLSDPSVITPINRHGEYWFKRDDLYGVGGANGGKVRGALRLAEENHAKGLVACGSRQSTMLSRAALVAKHMGLPCRVHTAVGEDTEQVRVALEAGAEVVRHRPGYLSVLKARAAEDAAARGWTLIPWGLEHDVNVQQTRMQVPAVLPDGVKRIVVPVGGGMTLAGVLHGLRDHGHTVPVLGVQVGGECIKRLDRYAPRGWQEQVQLVSSGLPYEEEVSDNVFEGVPLDPIYEAKCIAFLQPGDMLWVVGSRLTHGGAGQGGRPQWIVGDSQDLPTLLPTAQQVDMVLSCPPYGDLEVYSDIDGDISGLEHQEFMTAYQSIISHAVSRLRDNRFAAWVVGDFRDGRGFYRNFVSDTIAAFQAAGAGLYNEAILVTPVGSLPLRTGRQFQAGRKLGKTHQNVLIFYKGAPTTENIHTALGALRATLMLPEKPENEE